MKTNKQFLLLLAITFLYGACGNGSTNVPASEPEHATNTAIYDVAIYTSTASRSMLFKKTGADFHTEPDISPYTITLHPEERYQQMDGFGAAVTGAAAYNLRQMTTEDRATFLKELFDPDDGLGLSYVRVPIGGCDFSLSDYTCCDKPGIENFALTAEELDYIIPVLQEILLYNPGLKVMGSPWTCPRWMKVLFKGSSIPCNSWTGGHLNKTYYQDYATYFVKWIQAFEAQGISIYSITPQNEPLNGGNTASLLMEWDEERDFIKTALGPQLEATGLNVKIYVFDHNYNYDNIASQRQYPLRIYEDAEAAQYVSGAAYHNYGGSQEELNHIHSQRPDKELIFSEASIGEWHDGRNLNSNFAGAVEEGLNLVNNWCEAIIMWNLMLDMDKQPHRPKGCSTCYGVVDISTDYKTITRNCHYYEIGHLAKVVRPGAYRIKADGHAEGGLRYEAFLNADGSYAFVALNKTDAEKTLTLAAGNRSFSCKLPGKAAASIHWKE
jgi:glucosylceramidase